MTMRKTFEIKVLDKRKDGGRILINTASVDRDKDRVFPQGAKTDNYLKNPVVQWGHNYRDPWSTIGKTNSLSISPEGIVADFTLRPAANDQDPQSVILLLWNGDWVRTSSIGFIPKVGKPNDVGGTDFTEWELLEWSIVPIPANQDALRLAVKGFETEQRDAELETPAPTEPTDLGIPGRAWVRRATIESERGVQQSFISFYRFKVDVPEDAELLQLDPHLGGCTGVPHPDAGKSVWFRQAVFVPPLEFKAPWEDEWQEAVYAICERDVADETLIASPQNYWSVTELSEVIATLPAEKAWQMKAGIGYGINLVTRGAVERAKALGQRLAKRGRVLSAKNEGKIRTARDNLNEVLAEVENLPEIDDEKSALTHSSQTSPRTEEVKSAIPPHTTPMADPDAEWDGPQMMADCPNDREKLRLICAWVDDKGDPDAKQSYKFPHHQLDGQVVLRGVNNAMARVDQADIPDGDKPGVKEHLQHHQDQFDQEKTIVLCPKCDSGNPLPAKTSGMFSCKHCGQGFELIEGKLTDVELASEPSEQEKELLDGLQIITTLVKEVIS